MTDSFGINVNNKLTDNEVQMIADAGFCWVRIELTWASIEKTKGNYDFENSGYDRLNEALKEKGIRPYYVLAYENRLYEQERAIVTKEGREAFNNFVKAAARRYGGQSAIWEVWNEPNIGKFWNNQPSDEDYFLLTAKISPTIKKYDKTAKVVAPALAGINQDSLAWLKSILNEGVLKYVDAISVHPYQYGKPENVIDDYSKLRKLINSSSEKDIPIISGEWGYSMAQSEVQEPVGEMKQAEYLSRMYLINAQQDIPISIWYNWRNDGINPQDREQNFGITSYYHTSKLSFLSAQTLSKTLKGFKYNKRIKTNRTDDYVLEFVNAKGQKVIAFWTTSANHGIKLKLNENNGQFVTMLGIKYGLRWDKELNLNISSSPNYLVIK